MLEKQLLLTKESHH